MKVSGMIQKLFRSQGSADKNLNISQSDEQDMIHGVRELSSTVVKEVMVPRIDVDFVSIDDDMKETLQFLISTGHSRFPVYKDTIDNVVGMLHIKDVLAQLVAGRQIILEDIIRKPYFVPESKRLDSLLRELKRRKIHSAVAVDEYGGVSGIVCFEDIIELIIGDIQDEFDNETEEVIKLGEGIFLCEARANISDLNEKLGLSIPDQDFDTLGGYVFELFGKIPVRNEKVESDGIQYVIQETEGHKIVSIKIILPQKQEG